MYFDTNKDNSINQTELTANLKFIYPSLTVT